MSPSLQAEAVCLLERHLPNGELGMRVERLGDTGYLVHAPGHGDFVVSSDGSLIRCAPADDGWHWHRPLFGQVLPLAAALRGLELLHASAVVLHGHAIAFTGRSGSGKTSVAAHLAARGADLLTDDVLSLQCSGEVVLAHPGAPMANVASEQLASMSPAARARLGRRVGESEKIQIEPACMPGQPVPLGQLYFLERTPDAKQIAFERLDPPDPQQLLGATFLPHVVTPLRLTTQLQTCAAVSRHAIVYRMLAPLDVPAAVLAVALEQHVADLAR